MQARGKIAVAGATGNLGRHVVDVLENEGNDVVGMSRSACFRRIDGVESSEKRVSSDEQ